MSVLILPGAAWRPISYRAAAGTFEITPLGWILHTQVGYGSLFDYFNSRRAPDRKFTHGWIGKDGKGEQYTELYMKSWGNSAVGNGLYWSFEFEGKGNESLTPAQIATAARWHDFLHTANYLANKTGQKGVGVHNMLVPTACPGNLRAGQRLSIINLAKGLGLSPAPQVPPVVKTPVKTPVAPRPVSATKPKPIVLGLFPLHKGHVFGPHYGPAWQHSGYASGYDKASLFTWQRAMKQRGWNITVDGYYGDQTARIAKQFQKEKGLDDDSLIGVLTWNRTKILP